MGRIGEQVEVMKTYCGKCKRVCDVHVSIGPMEYEMTEFWGQMQKTEIGREVAALSECCFSAVYENEKCTVSYDTDRVDIEEYL